MKKVQKFAMSKESEDVWIKMYVEASEEFNKKVYEYVEHIVRNYVTPPIKGEITKGKMRWRGLSLAWTTTDNGRAFIGVKQRNTLITLDGKKYRLNTQN